MLKLLELFGGIGACTKALKRLGIEFEIVDYVEIDKYAVKSYNAINGTNFEPQDITKWDKDINVDLIMHGSPCQDFSLAGKQAGGDKDSGTRSSLMYETIRIVEKLKAKYVLWENVKNLLSKKHRHNFDAYLQTMGSLGYTNYYQVLNAKDYGIPQNRERVFVVSILKESIVYDDYNSNIRKDQDTIGTLTTNCGNSTIRNGWKIIENTQHFVFPQPKELKLRLKDMLEDNVDEKYYLSEKMINFFYKNEKEQKEKGNGFRFGVSDRNIIAKTVTTRAGSRLAKTITSRVNASNNDYLLIKNATKKGCLNAYDGDGVNISSRMKYQRGNVQPQSIQTITTSGGNERGVVVKDEEMNNLRIRKLTPKECWRLMGFDDEDVDKCIKAGISDTQLYKQAGNSIVVNVLEAIFRELFKESINETSTSIN